MLALLTSSLVWDEVEERYRVPKLPWCVCFLAPTLALDGRKQERGGWRYYIPDQGYVGLADCLWQITSQLTAPVFQY
jgi:hypothetical protein